MKSTDKTVRRSDTVEKRRWKKLLELAKCFRTTTDPKEAKRLGNELGRMVFGE